MKIQTISPKSEDIYWELSQIGNLCHASCTHNGYKISGSGLGYKYEIAKKIAFSELNERHLVLQLQKLNSEVNKWGLNIDNSCSGFAIGYSRESTVLRSALEGVERWALSQWVDEGYCLQRIDDPEFTTADFKTVVNSCFNSISIYYAVIPLFLFNKILNINVCSVLCWTELGLFVGYGSKLSLKEAIQHAYVESIRNYLIFNNQEQRDYFPYNRIHYFAKNKKIAEDIIKGATKIKWPRPILQMVECEKFGDLWLARTIFNGWKPWQFGKITRFLY